MYKIRSQTIPSKWYVVSKFGPDLHVCDCLWAEKGNTCKHVLKILDLLKGNKINTKDQTTGKFYLKTYKPLMIIILILTID